MIFFLVLLINSFHFTYSLDDAYIHLSMVKNIISKGIYGPLEQPSSSSSSLLWLITLYSFPFELSPLFFNFFIFLALSVLLERRLGTLKSLIILAVVGFLHITFIGMEHSLHILLLFALINVLFIKEKVEYGSVFILSLLATLTRYETLFFIVPTVIYFVFLRKYRKAAYLAFGSFLAVFIWGMLNLQIQGKFFPISVELKRFHLELSSIEGIYYGIIGRFIERLHRPFIFFLFLLSLAPLLKFKKEPHVIILPIVVFLHTQFGEFGWFYRYESYLVFLIVLYLSLVFNGIIFGLLLIPFIPRAIKIHIMTPFACNHIYRMHYTMSEFIKRYYNNDTVIIHDIGLVSYKTDAHLVDIWGLGSPEIAEIYLSGRLPDLSLIKGKIAIINSEWFRNRGIYIPWKRCGSIYVKSPLSPLPMKRQDIYCIHENPKKLHRNIEEFSDVFNNVKPHRCF